MRWLLIITVLFQATWADAGAGDYRRAGRMLSEWRIEEARKLIAELTTSSPKRPETRYLQAELAFLDGKYEQAIQHLDGLGDKEVGASVGRLRRLVTGTMEATKGFARKRSAKGHFEIVYQPGKDEVIVDIAADALDKAYEVFGRDLGIKPNGPIRVELLTKPADLAKVSTLTEKDIRTTGTIALCKYNKLMAVTPRATIFGYAWLDTLAHEYVHYLVSSATRDRVPVWLHEGLARFQQNRWRDPDLGKLAGTDEYLLASALKGGDLISFDAMHPSMAKLPSQQAAALAYAEVYTLVRFIHGKVGYDGLRKALAMIAKGTDSRDALTQVTGSSRWRKVESGWKQHLRASKLSMDPALAGRARHGRIHFDDGQKGDDNVGVDELNNKKAQKHTRLGGMLRARGMLKAAAIQYEKALAIAGNTNPLVAAKLSRTYIALREYERAIALAEPLLAADDNDAAPATTLGIAYQKVGEPKRATQAFEVALRINPFDPAVRCGLAEAYAATNAKSLEKREREACRRLSASR
jgi:tetratricopeptide (TPR) repeat protein